MHDLIFSPPLRPGVADVAPHLNFTGGAPPAALASLTMHLEFPAAPGALPPSPISLRCVLAHNTQRVPLLDARVWRTHSGSPVQGGYMLF
jgi:hypothetical protein